MWVGLRRFIRVRYPAFSYPRYRYYFYASLACVGATQLTYMGQGWLIYELSGSAFLIGFLGFCIAFPNLLITLFGGVLADRLNKKVLLAISNGIASGCVALLAILVLIDVVATWHVFTIAVLMSFASGIDWPARASFYPHVVDRPGYLSAIAINSFIWQVTRMAVPAIGGFLLSQLGTGWLFVFSAMGFMAMTLTMMAIEIDRVNLTVKQSPLRDLVEGVRFVVVQPMFRYLLLLTFVGMLFCNSHVQIMPIFAELVGGGEWAYGFLLSAGGLGAILGAILIGGSAKQDKIGSVLGVTASLAVILTFGFAAAAEFGYYLLALVLQFASAIFVSIFTIGSLTVMQLCVPDRLRGRVMGIHTMGYSMVPLGGVIVGYLVEISTVLLAMAACCTVYAITILVVFLSKGEIRQLQMSGLRQI